MAHLAMVPLTELDAVNVMLMSMGQSPVNVLTDTGIKDIEIAQLVLHNTSREIQDEGWAFNTDYAFDISPDGNDRILVPSNALSIDPVNRGEDFVQRWDTANSKMSMYDLIDQTFKRTKKLSVDITWFYPFEQIPQHARNYIALLAGQRFQAGNVASEILFRFEEADVNRARVILERNQNRSKDRNILSGPGYTNIIFYRTRNPGRFGAR